MSTLSAAELLQVWERGQRATLPERAIFLLDAAGVAPSPSQLPVGQRDGHLLALRERLFGRGMVCLAPCPKCGEKLELSLDTRQFGSHVEPPSDLLLEREGFRIRFRVPAAADLVACVTEAGVAAAEHRLLRNCLLDLRLHGSPIEMEDLPEEVVTDLASAMADADPGADLQVRATCPLCEHQWQSTFDIVSFLWTELQDWAIRVLREVHALALAYGWPERDILDLSPWRRRLYLQMVGR